METLVANFSGLTRRETVNGRKFIVAPLTMIVPGVLNGSAGPLLYPEDEVAASCPYWEGVILTDNHLPPGVNGRKIKTQQDYGMGYVQNPTIKNGRLKAEGWFDVDKTRRINPNILSALERGDKIELSTGLNVSFEDTSGIHNGRQYNQIVRKYRPDHLAILIGQRGACSVYDGCGVNNMAVANAWSKEARRKAAEAKDHQKYRSELLSRNLRSFIQNASEEEDMLNNQDIEDDYDNSFGPIINDDDDSELEDDFENDDDLDDEVEDEYDEENDFDDDFDEEDDEDWDDEEEDDVNNAWSEQARQAAAAARKQLADARDVSVKLSPKSKAAFEQSMKASTSQEHQAAADLHKTLRDRTGNEYRYDMHDTMMREHLKHAKNLKRKEARRDSNIAPPMEDDWGGVSNAWSDSARQAAAAKRKYQVNYRGKAWGSLPASKTFSSRKAAKKWYHQNKSSIELHSHGPITNAWSDQARQAARLARKHGGHRKIFGDILTKHFASDNPQEAFTSVITSLGLQGSEAKGLREYLARSFYDVTGEKLDPHKKSSNPQDTYQHGKPGYGHPSGYRKAAGGRTDNAWSDQARQAAKLKRQRQLRAKSFLESQGADPKVVGDEIHFTTGLGEAGKVVFHPTHMEEHVADKVFKHSNLRSLMRAWSEGVNNAWSVQARKAASAARWHKGGALEGHQEGDKVRINPDYGGSNKSGVVIQSVGNFHTVKHSNGSTAIYHESDLASTSRKAKVDNKSCKGKKKKKPVTNNKEPNMSLSQEQKDKLIDTIISNCDCYSEDDREALSELDDRMLKSVANGTQVNNAKNEPIKVSDLPVEMQRVLNYGAQAIEADKAKLIDRLVANQATDEAKKARREVLSKLTLDELQDRVADLPVEKVENQFDYTFQSYTPNFSGAGAGRYTPVNNQQTGPAGGNLGIPELDFSRQN